LGSGSSINVAMRMRAKETSANGVLARMDRQAFLRTVARAQADARDAANVRDIMMLWAERLKPYLDADAGMTISDALDRYKADMAAVRTRG
jgi:hypothetical protein